MKEINIPGTSFKAIICDNLNDVLKKALKYPPLSYNKSNIEKAIGKIILPGTIDLNIWQTLASYWKRYNVILSYAFYDPYEDYIFINLPSLGLKVSNECKLYTEPNTSLLQMLSKIIAHELIHYIFQNNIVSIFGYIRSLLLQWYKSFYSNMLYDNILLRVADAHFTLSLDANINMIDKDAAIVSRHNIERFMSILDKMKNSIYVKDIELLDETIKLMAHILSGRSMQISPKLESAFKQAYIDIYRGYSLDLSFGQELIYASEILARVTDIETQQAKDITRRLLNALKL